MYLGGTGVLTVTGIGGSGTVFVCADNAGSMYKSGGACVSDRDLKKNITEYRTTNVLGDLEKLKISTWEWKATSKAETLLGFIAQDLQAVWPLAVTTVDIPGQGQKLTIRYDALIAYLVEVAKAQQSQIVALQEQSSDLQAQVTAQQTTIDALSKRLDALEAGGVVKQTCEQPATQDTGVLGGSMLGLVVLLLANRRSKNHDSIL